LDIAQLKPFLEEKVAYYNQAAFVEADPICIPHRYEEKEDMEIAGFFSATLAWGNRKMIIRSASRIMEQLGSSPFDFVQQASDAQIRRLHVVHRTFQSDDLHYFIRGLRAVYRQPGGMMGIFQRAGAGQPELHDAIVAFRTHFFSVHPPLRTSKHVSDPSRGSAAKRLHMMLRWFVRKDARGVDLGIWHGALSPHQLSCPLDVHSGTVARALGLLQRKANDLKAVRELDAALRALDPMDPVKYDFALFGLGEEKAWKAEMASWT
jgi:uncharacterized protein (TIGR02757 family)